MEYRVGNEVEKEKYQKSTAEPDNIFLVFVPFEGDLLTNILRPDIIFHFWVISHIPVTLIP